MTKLPVEKLDRTRAHGQVYGEVTLAVAFTQRSMNIDAWPYDGQGQLVEAALTPEQKAALDARRTRASTEQEDPVADAKAAQALADEEPDAPAQKAKTEDDDVNFEMFLSGEVRYKPFALQKAAKARFGVNKSTPASLALWLLDNNKVPGMTRDQVSTQVLPAVQL